MKRIQYRTNTSTYFSTHNPILGLDEIGMEKDTGRQKVGDGTSQWLDLEYVPDGTSGSYLPLTGGTLTGDLTLPGNPTSNLHASTKQYVDGHLPLTGGTLTGPLTMSGNPTADLQAAPKQYVDSSFDHLGRAATFTRSEVVSIPTSSDTGLGDWSSTYDDAGVALFSGPAWIFYLPTGRWRISYSVFSDLALASGLRVFAAIGPWLSGKTEIPASLSQLHGSSWYSGAGGTRNCASFYVDSTVGNDALSLFARSIGTARNVSSATIQFERIR